MKSMKLGAGVLLFMAFVQLCSAAENRESVDEIRQVRADERITLDVMRGEVTLRPSADGSFRVSGLLDELADGFELDSANGFTRFEVRMPRRINGSGDQAGSDLIIEVPAASEVEFKSVNAQVEVSGIQGGTKITTVNGNVRASDLSGRVEISTVNGNIRTSAISGRVTVGTVNGNIDDTGSEGRLNLSAINGRIETLSIAREAEISVVNGRISAEFTGTEILKLSSVNGNISVALSDSVAPRIEGSTVSGSIVLTLHPDTSARFRLSSNAGGSIQNSFSQDQVARSTFGPARRLEFSTGEGSGSIELSSVSGPLVLRRR
jgi:DUF4097 and DUF4098 domain-containing protein YvlB